MILTKIVVSASKTVRGVAALSRSLNALATNNHISFKPSELKVG